MTQLDFEGGGSSFERFDGAAGNGADTTRYECGVCWQVYDPARGDETQKVPPGTPFRLLPEEWRCPNCDTERRRFIALDAGKAGAVEETPEEILARRVAALEKAYRKRDPYLKDLPIYNGLLGVEAVGFRPFQGHAVGVLITPCAINIVRLPLDPRTPVPAEGAKQSHAFPSGEYEFIAGRLDGFGAYEMASLFSPVFEFDDQAVARLAAQAAADGLFEADEREPPEPSQRPAAASRRQVLFGAGRT